MTGHVVASQFGADFDARLRAARPELQVLSLPRSWTEPLPRHATVLLAWPFSPAQRDLPPPAGWPGALRWIQLVSVGVDFYPGWLLNFPRVSTAHGVSAATISDFALACVLQHALRLRERRAPSPEQWKLTSAPGLAGSTLGLFGFGHIGRALAGKAAALGLRVLALRKRALPLNQDGVDSAENLSQLLAESDHLVLVAPATPQTRHVINRETLAQARPGLHLVNVSRGSLVDQDALRAALDEGRIAFASLDVAEPEPLPAGHWLYSHPRVQLTPHTSAISPQVQDALLVKVLRGLQALDQGQTPDDLVDLARGY